MLKPHRFQLCKIHFPPAAFRRLCVETPCGAMPTPLSLPAAFRRLCVETAGTRDPDAYDPAAFRRLCVETAGTRDPDAYDPAAFRRLCVETSKILAAAFWAAAQPPSGGCVLKLTFGNAHDDDLRQPPSGGCVLKRPFGRESW